jgi:hypothetical protein
VIAKRPDGIDDAIQLMRTLPLNQNLDLVLLVVRNTLASMNVELKHVIDDGTSKEDRLGKTITNIKAGLADLEREMAARKQELAAVEADLAETRGVKERLELAAQREIMGSSHGGGTSGRPLPPPTIANPEGDRETMEVDPQQIESEQAMP